MDVLNLKEFVSLFETCSYFETSDLLHISQSSLTKHIQKMEEELEVTLFDRSTRSVRNNEYGEIVHKYASQILALYNEAIKELNELKAGSSNNLTIGFQPFLAQFGVLEMLHEFSNKHPEITLTLVEGTSPTDLLLSHKCDFALGSADGVSSSEIIKRVYIEDTIAAVLPKDHRLADRTSIAMEELRDEDFIFHSVDHNYSSSDLEKLKGLCKASGFEPRVITTVSFVSTIVKLVTSGKGVSVINRMRIPINEGDISVVDIEPEVNYHIYIMHLKNKKPTNAAEVFREYIKNT